MVKFLSKYAGQMAFSLIGTVLGALIVTNLGLYSPFAQAPQPTPAIETVAAPSAPATKIIEESHQAIRERLDANQAEANRIAEAERRAKAEAAEAAARAEEAARIRAAALAAQERARKAAAAKREITPVVANTPPVHAAGPVAPPVNIVPPPAPASELTRGNPFVDLADTVKSTAGKVRDKFVEALRLDRIFRNPFGNDADEAARDADVARQRLSGLDL
jgi:hypothetical protein